MVRLSILTVSGACWAFMMFLLFQREIQPYFEYEKPPSYRTMWAGRARPEAQYRVITVGAEEIGQAETVTDPLPAQGFRMRTRFALNTQKLVSMPLRDDRVTISSEVQVDETYHLSRFRMDAAFPPGIRVDLEGERWGSKLRIIYHVGRMKREQLVDFPSEAMLGDNFLPYMGGARMEVGRKWRMPQLDLDALILPTRNPSLCRDVYAAVTAREFIRYQERDVPVYRVEVRRNPGDAAPMSTSFVDDTGQVLQQMMTPSGAKLQVTMTLQERRFLEDGEAAVYPWRVETQP